MSISTKNKRHFKCTQCAHGRQHRTRIPVWVCCNNNYTWKEIQSTKFKLMMMRRRNVNSFTWFFFFLFFIYNSFCSISTLILNEITLELFTIYYIIYFEFSKYTTTSSAESLYRALITLSLFHEKNIVNLLLNTVSNKMLKNYEHVYQVIWNKYLQTRKKIKLKVQVTSSIV